MKPSAGEALRMIVTATDPALSGLDWAMLVATAVAACAAVASAVVAIIQARAAKRSEGDAVTARDAAREARDESARLASEANAAFIRQAEAQEKATTIREADLRPEPWSDPHEMADGRRLVVNTSGRTIMVESTTLEPVESEPFIRVEQPENGIYQDGDSWSYQLLPALTSPKPRKLKLAWRFVDDPQSKPDHYRVWLL